MKKLHERDPAHLLIDLQNLENLLLDFRDLWKGDYPNLSQIEKENIDSAARKIKEGIDKVVDELEKRNIL